MRPMVVFKRALPLSLALIIFGCHKSPPAWQKHSFKNEDRSTSGIQANLPRSLWLKLTSVLSESGGGGGGEKEAKHGGGAHEASHDSGHEKGGEAGGAAKVGSGLVPSLFAPIKVYLVEMTPGVLSRGSSAVSFASGGGTLDLHDFVAAGGGEYSLVVEFMPEIEAKDRHVFFLSNSQVRKSLERTSGSKKDRTFGSGCNSYFEISSMFNRAMLGNGVVVDSEDRRDVSVLSGTFYFAASVDKKLYLASLTVKDSSLPKLSCRP